MKTIFIGLRDAIERFRRMRHFTPAKLTRGMMAAGRQLQRDSMLLVPVDTGTLKRSATTVLRKATGTGIVIVDVKYSTYYALAVHEILYYYHKPPTQAKFLEQPARMHRDKYLKTIQRHTFAP